MSENKNKELKFRLTDELLQKIELYCEKNKMNKSEFARFACEKIFNSWVDKNE
jgi:hypothetical protein